MIRRPPRSTLFPYTTPSDLADAGLSAAAQREFYEYRAQEAAERRNVVFTALAATLGLAVVTAAILVLLDRKSTRLNSSHANISYAVFCLKKKTNNNSISV